MRKTALLILPVALLLFSFSLRYDINESYDRTFSSYNAFYQNEKEFNDPKAEFLFFLPSHKGLVYAVKKQNKEHNFEINYLSEVSLNPYKKVTIKLPENSSVVYADEKQILYRHKLNFYRYNQITKCADRINKEGTIMFEMLPISNTTAICLGDIMEKNTNRHTFGFFLFDFERNEIDSVLKELHVSETNQALENSLKYTGKFIPNGHHIMYVHDFYGKIELFDGDNGNFQKEITTIDRVKEPEIVHYQNMYTYKRGTTFYSNSGGLIKDDYLYVFSCRPNDTEYIIVDQYLLETGKYNKSFKLKYQGKKSSNINYISYDSNKNFVLGFSNFYQGFTINLDQLR